GSRKGIPEQLQEDFRVTGLSHIVAISGYNITLVVSIMMAVFRPLGRRLSIIISAIAVILFTLFVGASPAVVRACIMGLIALVALNSERKGDVTIALALTATLMIGYNPKILFHDVGFQLSFLATMGLIYVSPLLEKYFQWLPEKLAIRDSILLTLSAQIMALPIILYNFNNLSVISPISNLLISGPFIPLTMLFGFLGTLTSYVFLPLAKLVAFPAYLLLEYIVNITHLTASIPYASVEVSWFSNSLLLGYFIILATMLKYRWQGEERQHRQIIRRKLEFAQILARKTH
ncbi:MAG: ComEC/Rec2 family competence protein, partial [bacterium]|nr:ComEC/Rec2 family competence protein [bacterium]